MNEERKWAIHIANAIINRSIDKKINLSTSKLVKLMYLMQKEHILKFGIPMFDDEFNITNTGPMLKEVYNYYRPQGFIQFKNKIPPTIVLLDAHAEIVDQILDEYGDKKAYELVEITSNDEVYKYALENQEILNYKIPNNLFWKFNHNNKRLINSSICTKR